MDDLESFITEVTAIADAVAAKRRSPKRIMLSLDEWNVWYRARSGEQLRGQGWPEAPPLLEAIYNMEDALVIGGALLPIINHHARVNAASLAPSLNVKPPTLTE